MLLYEMGKINIYIVCFSYKLRISREKEYKDCLRWRILHFYKDKKSGDKLGHVNEKLVIFYDNLMFVEQMLWVASFRILLLSLTRLIFIKVLRQFSHPTTYIYIQTYI